MPGEKNEMLFTTRLDSSPLIAEAKELAKKINQVLGKQSDNKVVQKTLDLLKEQTKEMVGQSNALKKQDNYNEKLASVNAKKALLEEKYASLTQAEKNARSARIKIDAGRDTTVNRKNLADAENSIARLQTEIPKLESSITKGEADIASMEGKSRQFIETWGKFGDIASQVLMYLDGTLQDTSALEKYIKSAEGGVEGIEEAGKGASNVLRDIEENTKGVETAAEKAQRRFEEMKAEREGLGSDWGLDLDADVTKMDDAALTKRKDELQEVVNVLRGAKIPDHLTDFFNRVNQALIETNRQLADVHGNITKSFDISKMKVPDLSADVTKMGKGELEVYKSDINAFMKALKELGLESSQEFNNASLAMARADAQLKQVNADLKATVSPKKETKLTFGVDADITKMSIEQLLQHSAELKARMKEVGASSSEFRKLRDASILADQAIKQYTDDLKGVKKNTDDSGAATRTFADNFKLFSDTFVSVSQASGILGKVKAGIESIGPAAVTAGIMSREALTAATAGINLVIEVVARLLTIIQTVVGVLKSMASAIINAFKKVFDVLKKVASMIRDVVSKAADKAKNAFKNLFPDQSDLKSTLRMLTKYIFGVRSFFFLYRKLRSGVKEGLENLVQFESESNETNHAITELRTSLLYLKNAWAAAFAPIINAVYPILVKFMDLLAAVGNTIARFVAALTGQKTVLQALRVGVGDYADSLNDAAGGAGKAADKQKDLNDRLAEFDDLNVLGRDKDPTTSGSGGGGGGADDNLPNIEDMFERIKTPISDLAKLLREAWETGEGFDLGRYIGTKISDGLDRAHAWLTGEGRQKVMKVAHLIATTIDGILSVDTLGAQFGQVFADVFNLFLDVVDEIITPTRMYKIGEQIVNAFNSAIPQILPRLGSSFGNLFSSAIALAWGFISNANFSEWGQSLGQLINNFFNKMGQTIQKGTKTESAMNGWQMLGASISELAQGFLDFILSALEEVDWHQVGVAIGQFLGSINFDDIASGMGNIGTAIKDALTGVTGGIGSVNSQFGKKVEPVTNIFTTLIDVIPRLTAVVQDLLSNIDANDISAFLNSLPELITRIVNAIENIAAILEQVFGKIGRTVDWTSDKVDKVNGVIQTGSDILSHITNAVPGATGVLGTVNEAARRAAEGIHSFFSEGGFGGGSGKNASLPSAINNVAESLKDTEDTATRVKGAMNFDSVANQIKGVATESTMALKDIPNKFTEIKGAADTQSAGIKNQFTSSFSIIKQESVNSSKVMQDNFTLASDNIKNSFINAWQEIKKSMSEGGDMFVALSDGMGNTVKALLNAMITGINISITKPLQDISKSFNVLRALNVNGAKPFAGIPYLNVPNIPHLAQGAVIPPNREFMAVLGDQRSGTNIEAPLDTIKQAVAEVLATNGNAEMIALLRQLIQTVESKNLTIGDREIGKANARYVAQQQIARGTML